MLSTRICRLNNFLFEFVAPLSFWPFWPSENVLILCKFWFFSEIWAWNLLSGCDRHRVCRLWNQWLKRCHDNTNFRTNSTSRTKIEVKWVWPRCLTDFKHFHEIIHLHFFVWITGKKIFFRKKSNTAFELSLAVSHWPLLASASSKKQKMVAPIRWPLQ